MPQFLDEFVGTKASAAVEFLTPSRVRHVFFDTVSVCELGIDHNVDVTGFVFVDCVEKRVRDPSGIRIYDVLGTAFEVLIDR